MSVEFLSICNYKEKCENNEKGCPYGEIFKEEGFMGYIVFPDDCIKFQNSSFTLHQAMKRHCPKCGYEGHEDEFYTMKWDVKNINKITL